MAEKFSFVEPMAMVLDGSGGKLKADPRKPIKLKKGQKFLWHHMDYEDPATIDLLSKGYGLSDVVVEALTDTLTRPRYFIHNDGIVFMLRAINTNRGADEHDMISLRVWIDEEKIITICHREIKAIKTIMNLLENGKGPKDNVDCWLALAEAIADDIIDSVSEISYKTDALEAKIVSLDASKYQKLRSDISSLRRKIVSMRRYLVPSRDVYINFKLEKSSLFKPRHRAEMREICNKIVKAIEDVEYARDHLGVSFEELQSNVSMKISQTMYIISIVTIIFMPMGLLTSLLGINVEGIPFADNPYAFWLVCGFLATVCSLLMLFVKRIKWL